MVIPFFWIWSIKKVYIICYIPIQIIYMGKIWGSWDMCQNALCQSDCKIFKSTVSLEQNKSSVFARHKSAKKRVGYYPKIGVIE